MSYFSELDRFIRLHVKNIPFIPRCGCGENQIIIKFIPPDRFHIACPNPSCDPKTKVIYARTANQ